MLCRSGEGWFTPLALGFDRSRYRIWVGFGSESAVTRRVGGATVEDQVRRRTPARRTSLWGDPAIKRGGVRSLEDAEEAEYADSDQDFIRGRDFGQANSSPEPV